MRALAWSLAGVLLLVAGLLLFLETGPGRRVLVSLIEDFGSSPGAEIRLEGLEGSIWSRLSVTSVTLSDDQGAWLAVQQASFEWRPSALLQGRLVVAALQADRVALDRLPPASDAPEEETTGDPLALPSLPVEVELQELAIGEVALGEPILGTPASLTLQADAGLDGQGARLNLDLQRLDGPAGSVTATLAWRPAEDHLDLALKVDEPAGGLAARLLDLPDLPAVKLDLAGSGPLSSWQGKLDLALNGTPAMAAAMTIDGRDKRTLVLDGTIAPTPLLPPEALPWVGEGLTLAARLTLGEEALGIEQLDLASSAVALRLAGSVGLESEEVDLSGQVSLRDPKPLLDLVPDITLTGAELSLTAKGPLSAPALTLTADLAAPAMAELATLTRLRLNLTADPQGPDALGTDGYAVTLDAGLEGPTLLDPSLPPWIWGDATLTAAALVNIDSGSALLRHATLKGDKLDLALDGTLSLPDGASDLAVALQAALPPLPETDNQSLDLTLQGRVTGADVLAAPTVELTAAVGGAEGLSGGIGPLLGADPRLAGALSLAEDGTITLTKVTLKAARADLSVDGTYGPQGVALGWQVVLPDLAAALEPFGTAAAGSLTLDGRLEGPSSEDFAITAKLAGENLAMDGQAIGTLQGDVTLSGLPNQPQGSIALNAPDSPYGPLVVAASVMPRGDGGFDVAPLSVALGDALKLDGQLQASAAGLPLIGEIKGTITGGPLWARSFGLPLAGRGTLVLTLTAPQGRQDAALTLNLGPGRVADIGHGGLRTTARLTDLLGAMQVDARADVTALAVEPARLDRVVLTARGPMTGLALTLETNGTVEGLPDEGAVALSLTARLEQAADRMTLALSRLTGTAGGLPIALQRPTTLTIAGDTLSLAPTTLTVADSTIQLEARNGGSPRLNLTVQGLDLEQFAAFLGSDANETISGRIDLALALSGGGNQPSGTLELTAKGLAIREGGLSQGPPVNIQATGRLGRGRFDLDGKVSGDFGRDLTLNASLPLQLSLQTFAVSVPQNGSIAGSAKWNGEIAALIDFLPLDNQALTGQATLDVTVAGTVAAPLVSGGFRLDKGKYENLLTQTVLADLTLDIAGEGHQITIRKATATDGAKGRLAVEGRVDLAAAGFGGDIKLTMRDFKVLRRDDLQARMDADLALTEKPEGLALTGRIVSDQVDVDINANLPPSVTTLDVTYLRDGVPVAPPLTPEQQAAADAAADAPVFTLLLDMTVDLPRRVYVSGNGLESEWAGHLTITGTADKPLILGSLSPVRGQFDLVGKTFMLNRGAITFDGSADIDPALDLDAVHTTSDMTATIHIGGRASRPKLTITSSPEMPQEEILSRVLFNRGSGRLSAIEALQLGEAAAIFSGVTGSDKTVVQRLRDTFGLDVLRIEGGENGEAVQATLGQYIAPDIFVGVVQGSTPGSTAAKVEVDITDSIKLEGTAGADANTSVGVRWQWDY